MQLILATNMVRAWIRRPRPCARPSIIARRRVAAALRAMERMMCLMAVRCLDPCNLSQHKFQIAGCSGLPQNIDMPMEAIFLTLASQLFHLAVNSLPAQELATRPPILVVSLLMEI